LPLEPRTLQSKGKEKYVADLVNFMFTWLDQEEKSRATIPLRYEVKELKIFVEPE